VPHVNREVMLKSKRGCLAFPKLLNPMDGTWWCSTARASCEEHPFDRIANLLNRTTWVGARIRKLSGSRRDRVRRSTPGRDGNERACETAFCRRYNAAEEKRSKNVHGVVLASRVVSRTGTFLMVDMPR
jgi:hypothetical protein